ncbi:MAG: two-component sensor histidine kinase [Rhodobacterales bacterium]|nr:MAG: two-component sensor histidine kinase [Rhodobacterales bacterium]
MDQTTPTTPPLIEALPLPALTVQPDERIGQMNEGARALFGMDLAGMHYITALRQPALLDAIEESLRDSQKRTARYLGRDGVRDATWKVSLARAGQVLLATFEDVTAVEEAGQMRRDFVANVSHELRTPLTALLGFIETLGGPARDDPVARDRFLEIMAQEAGRMSRLVEDLLSLSRVEEEERVRPLSPVDMGALIRGTVDALTPVADAAGRELVVDVPDDPVSVPGDARQLRQVLTNLVENAIKYGRDRVEISLTEPAAETALRGPGIRVSVKDYGEGIPEHHIARLTERFYRVDSHRSREVGGTGLGLAIVKHIVNRHRGRLRIESTPSEGSTFTVLLPLE